MKILALLFLLISCGKDVTGKRCYSEEEALLYCQAKEMKELNVSAETAKLICAPYYTGKACYYL